MPNVTLPTLKPFNLAAIDVEAYYRKPLLSKCHSEREPDVSHADDTNQRRAGLDLGLQFGCLLIHLVLGRSLYCFNGH